MPALQYNVFIHDVDKLITLNSELLMTKGVGGVANGVSSSSLLISLNSQLLMTKGGWGGDGVSSSSLIISPTKLIAAQQWNETDFHCCMPAQLSALTHVMQICGNFDFANSSRYHAGFAPMLFQWSHLHMKHFLSQFCCDFFTVQFFCSRPLFIVQFFTCRVIFHVETVGYCCLFQQLVALLFIFPIDNRYEYILMHFKGLTDLVNSAT